jgi:hypothetical protein
MNKAKVKISRKLAEVMSNYAGDELPEPDKAAAWSDLHEQIGQRDYQDQTWKTITLMVDLDQATELTSWSDYEADMASDYCDTPLEAGARAAMMRGLYNRAQTAYDEIVAGKK